LIIPFADAPQQNVAAVYYARRYSLDDASAEDAAGRWAQLQAGTWHAKNHDIMHDCDIERCRIHHAATEETPACKLQHAAFYDTS
jgi:hypothetical protein